MSKILLKFPTRSRPQTFLNVLRLLVENSSNPKDINYLVSYDIDDPTMQGKIIEKTMSIPKYIAMFSGHSHSKIHACNRDINQVTGWDIVVLMSDDMIPQTYGWDEIIRQKMQKHFPDTDGALWFNDGYQDRICTLNIFGKKYYDRFGYLYHPHYTSLWCDNEMTEVAKRLEKLQYFPDVIFKHEHPMNNTRVRKDRLYDKNESYYHADEKVYKKRELINFDL